MLPDVELRACVLCSSTKPTRNGCVELRHDSMPQNWLLGFWSIPFKFPVRADSGGSHQLTNKRHHRSKEDREVFAKYLLVARMGSSRNILKPAQWIDFGSGSLERGVPAQSSEVPSSACTA